MYNQSCTTVAERLPFLLSLFSVLYLVINQTYFISAMSFLGRFQKIVTILVLLRGRLFLLLHSYEATLTEGVLCPVYALLRLSIPSQRLTKPKERGRLECM
jgi:hypothetical protein